MAANYGPADDQQEENVFRLSLAVQPESRHGSFVRKSTGDDEQSATQDAIIRNGYIEQLDQNRQRVLMRPGRAIYSELDRPLVSANGSHEFLFGIHYYGGRNLADSQTPTLAVVSRGDLYINPIKSASTGQKWKALTDGPWNTSDGGFNNEAQFVSNSTGATTFAIISGRGGTRSVYSTINQGGTWTLLTSAPGWVARSGFRVIRLSLTFYILGGRNAAGTLLNDVWSSTDGITWTQQTAAAGWAAREYFSIMSLGSLIYIAGGDTGSLEDDVWSSPTGVTWTQRTAAGGWAARKNAGFVGSGTTLYLAGGELASGNAVDLWLSINQGVTWSRQFDAMPISARTLSFLTGTNTAGTPPFSRPVLVSRLVATNGSTGLAFSTATNLSTWWAYTADSAVTPGHGQFVLSALSGKTTGHLTVGSTIKKLWLGQVSPFYEQAYTDIFPLGGGESAADDSSFKVYFESIPLPDLVQKVGADGIAIQQTTAGPPLEGFAFKSSRDAYFYNTQSRSLSKITSPNFPARTVGGFAWLNGRLYVMTPEGRIYGSGINDYTTWAALDFINAIMHPDNGVGLIRSQTYIIAFGRNSTEVFYDSGAAIGNPLRRVDSAAQDIGCIDAATIVQVDNITIFAGSTDKVRAYGVYQLQDGYIPKKISPVYVDKALSVGDFSGMHALPLFLNGHRFYVITGTCGGFGTWVYDRDTQMWFNWTLAQIDGFEGGGDTTATAALNSAGLVEVTINNPNLFTQPVVGEPVKITGADQSEYNVETTVHTSPDFFTFTYILPTSTLPTTPATGDRILATLYPQYDSDGQGGNPGYYKWTCFDSAAIDSPLTHPPSYVLVVDEADGNVYRVSDGLWSDRDGLVKSIHLGANTLDDAADRTYIDFLIRTPRFDAGNHLRKFINRCEVIGGNSDTQGLVRYSDDDYRTWSPYRRVDLTLERPRLQRQGSMRRRAYEYRQVFKPSTVNDQEVYFVEALELFYKQGTNV